MMIGGLVTLAVAMIGLAYAALILQAASRRDNLVFGVLTIADGAMAAWRGLVVLSGTSIISPRVTLPCAIGTIVLAVLTIEFIVGFPRRRAMRWRWRAPLIAWAAVSIVLVCIESRGMWGGGGHAELMFFAPSTVLIFVLGAIAYRRAPGRDARTVIAMLWFRWGFGFIAYFLGPRLGIFEAAVWAETVFAAPLSFVVIGTAVLRSELFSIRSSAAEAVTLGTIALIVALGGGAAVGAALAWTEPGRWQHLALFGASLVPLALAAAGWRMYPRLEHGVLAGLDARRARRHNVQDEPLPADAALAITEATARITAIADGAQVRWSPAAALPAPLVAALADGKPRRRDDAEDATAAELPACFVVPAIGADRVVVGAFLVDGGTIDRDTWLVARDLGSRVAVAVERADAITALDDARRLAALGQFAAAIAHDIRTPLTSISLNVQILRRKLELSADDREHLDIALEELGRLDRSVAEILDFAKPVRLVAESIDVGELIETATRGLSPVLSEKGVALRCEPATAALAVHGDAKQLRQVLVNLLDNAADASARGAAVTVRASVSDDDQRVSIEVEDRGCGIGAEDLPRIFEPFFTTRPDGTGLGLAICHKVVRAHGGELRVRSIVGEGSTFTVLLPAA